jgi:hypothetical protein
VALFAGETDELLDLLGDVGGARLSEGLDPVSVVMLDTVVAIDSCVRRRTGDDSRSPIELLHLGLRHGCTQIALTHNE